MVELTDQLYTPAEVARICKVKPAAVYQWMRKGMLRWIVVGSDRRVTREELQRFLFASTPAPQVEQPQPDSVTV